MSAGKILVVDDDINICELLRLYIEKEDFEVVIANDGNEALRLFESEKPDFVMLDIMLPGRDGWQVCRDIRSMSSCPIIMLTAKGEVFDKVLGLELGADDYVVKPFEAKCSPESIPFISSSSPMYIGFWSLFVFVSAKVHSISSFADHKSIK